jgi:hypothetical protein
LHTCCRTRTVIQYVKEQFKYQKADEEISLIRPVSREISLSPPLLNRYSSKSAAKLQKKSEIKLTKSCKIQEKIDKIVQKGISVNFST